MRNNERNTTIASEPASLAPNISEYKIGKTTYIVELHFNLECESLEEIVKRLIVRNSKRVEQAA